MSAHTQASFAVTPERIMQLGLGFAAAKVLLSAIELDLFTLLAGRPRTASELREALGLHDRAVKDFLDALVAHGLLERREGVYSNAAETDLYLDRNKPTYAGGLLEMANARLYGFWGSLTEALRTGKAQNETRNGNPDIWQALYADPERLKMFLSAMTGLSLGTARALAQKFPWTEYRNFLDVGCAQGGCTAIIAEAHPHLTGAGYDLPAVGPIFEEYIRGRGLDNRLSFVTGDFFREPLPAADIIVMGHILHDYGIDQKLALVDKAWQALPDGGAFIVYEALIDDGRRNNAFGLIMSLNMLIETEAGFDYTGAECMAWMREAGFRKCWVEHLAGPESMVAGIK